MYLLFDEKKQADNKVNYDYVSAKYYTIIATMNDPGEASELRESRKAKAAEVLAHYY